MTAPDRSNHRPDMSWLLDNFLARVPGVSHALVLSVDGLPLAANRELPEDRQDQLAAVASGMASLTNGAARFFEADPVVQTLVEMHGGFLLIMSVEDAAVLVVLARQDCDIARVGHEMTLLVDSVGTALNPVARQPSGYHG